MSEYVAKRLAQGLQCANCHFWEGERIHDIGECHRFPPTGTATSFWDKLRAASSWSQTHGTRWCGEFKKREMIGDLRLPKEEESEDVKMEIP